MKIQIHEKRYISRKIKQLNVTLVATNTEKWYPKLPRPAANKVAGHESLPLRREAAILQRHSESVSLKNVRTRILRNKI